MKDIIIDNNLICALLSAECPLPIEEFRAAFLYGQKYRIRAVLGGRLEDEYEGHVKYRKMLIRLIQAGKIFKIQRASIDALEKTLIKTGNLSSDDPHIIALAKISGARVLCSHDNALHEDFTNPNLIAKPRGKIWQHDEHNHLLK